MILHSSSSVKCWMTWYAHCVSSKYIVHVHHNVTSTCFCWCFTLSMASSTNVRYHIRIKIVVDYEIKETFQPMHGDQINWIIFCVQKHVIYFFATLYFTIIHLWADRERITTEDDPRILEWCGYDSSKESDPLLIYSIACITLTKHLSPQSFSPDKRKLLRVSRRGGGGGVQYHYHNHAYALIINLVLLLIAIHTHMHKYYN